MVVLIVLAVAMPLMAPGPGDDVREVPEAALQEPLSGADAEPTAQQSGSPADWLETSRLGTSVMGVLLGLYLVLYFLDEGFDLTLDIVNAADSLGVSQPVVIMAIAYGDQWTAAGRCRLSRPVTKVAARSSQRQTPMTGEWVDGPD